MAKDAAEEAKVLAEVKEQGIVDPYNLLGKRISVYWPLDRKWFVGRILNYNKDREAHFVRYEDGDVRWYHLPTKHHFIIKHNEE